MNNDQIATIIKSVCKLKNVSINQMLKDCGITKSFIYDLEKRNMSPSCDRIAKIANYFDCSIDYLVGRTNNPDSHKL